MSDYLEDMMNRDRARMDNFENFLSNLFQGASDKYIGTNYQDQEAATVAWQRQLQLRQMDNEYNSPAQQMQRAREAGLNPSLVYGQPIAESAAPSAPQASGGRGSGDLLASMMQMSSMPAQIDNLKADAELKRANANRINSLLPEEVSKFQAEVGSLKQGINESIQRIRTGAADEQYKLAMVKLLGKDYELKDQQLSEALLTLNDRLALVKHDSLIRQEEFRTFNDNLNSIIDLRKSQAYQAIQSGKLSAEQVKTVEHYIKVLDAQKKVLDAQYERITKENGFITANQITGVMNSVVDAGKGIADIFATFATRGANTMVPQSQYVPYNPSTTYNPYQ